MNMPGNWPMLRRIYAKLFATELQGTRPIKLRTIYKTFFETDPCDLEAIKAIKEQLADVSRYAPDTLARIMDAWLDVATRTVEAPGKGVSLSAATTATVGRMHLSATEAYRLVLLFAYPGMAWFVLRADVESWFLAHHQTYLKLIDQALLGPDLVITTHFAGRDTGRWTDIVHGLLCFYSQQLSHSDNARAMQRDAALLVPDAYRHFPDHRKSWTGSVLEHHPDGLAKIASLLRFYALEYGNSGGGPMEWLGYDIYGLSERRDGFTRKNAVKILDAALRDGSNWPEEVASDFVDRFVLVALEAEPMTQAVAAENLKRQIDSSSKSIANPPKPPSGISAANDLAHMLSRLRENETELALIESDFNGWQEARLNNAARTLAQSTQARKAAERVVARLPATVTSTVRDILMRAAVAAARPKKYPMPNPSDNRFKDFGLKLLVIEELMYRQDWLAPRFDIYEFTKEWEAREISVEDDGYSIIPEAERYFQNLAIPDDLLSRVETLHQSSGMDGGPGFMTHLYPFYDPGCGDQPIPVTIEAIKDLALLPKLRLISELENSRPDNALIEALGERDIMLIDEAASTFQA